MAAKKPPAQRSLLPEEPQPPGRSLTRLGSYSFDEAVSALQKCIRLGQVEQAVHWVLVVYDASPRTAIRRLLCSACEDVGIADPEVVAQVASLCAGWEAVAGPAPWRVDPNVPVLAAMLLARARKSSEVDDLKNLTLHRLKHEAPRPVPPEALDVHTARGRAEGLTARDWYRDRVVAIPESRYAAELFQLRPEDDPREERA